jgi:hypothetical protein
MAIVSNEIKIYKSAVISNGITNGGRLTSNLYPSDTLNDLFQGITPAERTAGFSRYRKLHVKFDNASDVVAVRALTMLSDISSATGIRNTFFEGTQRNTQTNITGSERKYGVGRLNTNANSGTDTLIVDYETGSAADTVVQVGDIIYVSDGTNKREYEVDTVSWAGEQCTITLTENLVNNYLSATPTIISTCLVSENVEPTVSNWVETSGAGTYDEVTYPVLVGNLATIEQTWTVTFTSATAFGVVGDTLGSVGTGTTGGNFAPNNADFSLPYFTLYSAGWGGTWANGNTVVFQTHPCSLPIWIKEICSAGAAQTIDTGKLKTIVYS